MPHPNEHLSLAKHLTAETKTEEFLAGKGVVTRWERLRRQNHWFDALYNACCAAHACGVTLVDEQQPESPPPRRQQPQQRHSIGSGETWGAAEAMNRWWDKHRW